MIDRGVGRRGRGRYASRPDDRLATLLDGGNKGFLDPCGIVDERRRNTLAGRSNSGLLLFLRFAFLHVVLNQLRDNGVHFNAFSDALDFERLVKFFGDSKR